MTTIATLLSGGEGVGVGARAAGLSHLWGIEIDDTIAGVARDNGFKAITAAIQDVDPHTLERPDVLHASPECMRASNAYNDPDADTLEEKECALDLDVAGCIVRYLEVLRPKVFTLENVFGYRRFQSFRMIMAALCRLGYFSDVQHLNAADFGVPQTRRRLILRAVRGGLVPMLPAPEPWQGWYAAIEDLIPTLPESKFAPWQLARLPEAMGTTLITNQHDEPNGNGGPQTIYPAEPCAPITATIGGRFRAFILSNAATEWGDGVRGPDEPVHTVTEQSNGRTRAFLMNKSADKYGDGLAYEEEPAFTVVSNSQGRYKAWLSQGRVVKMMPRCLARFQSFPDSYRLPEHNGLACRVIGNAVASLMYEKLVRGLTLELDPAETGGGRKVEKE